MIDMRFRWSSRVALRVSSCGLVGYLEGNTLTVVIVILVDNFVVNALHSTTASSVLPWPMHFLCDPNDTQKTTSSNTRGRIECVKAQCNTTVIKNQDPHGLAIMVF